MKTGIPFSKDDPLFALVEIFNTVGITQEKALGKACNEALDALKAAAQHLDSRGQEFQLVTDTYLQNRLEAANATLEFEAQRLTQSIQEPLCHFKEDLKMLLLNDIKSTLEESYKNPLVKAEDVFPEHSWIDSLWTLTACLAIGFLLGFIYFNGTIRGPLLSHMELLANKLPSSTLTSKH